ncbi:hypothetical protein GF362_07370 [Candidatus Dojkabacteria bacterium]|nr:hypothetical protein [Candidatus Dojkabacteria bacterium]
MDLIVDLHIHSHFSRATSKSMTPENMYRWAKIKGINVLATADFTHPDWFSELREKLEPAEPGLFKLKEKYSKQQNEKLPKSVKNNVMRFILSVEISNIYSKNEKVRKLHNNIITPSFESASEINARLAEIGNLKADGRPILGMDSKELLKISLETDPDNLFIPSHIWTPWFSMFGSKSGFDSIEEAFEELASEIKVIETGLSSDPYMNWRIKEIQKRAIISSSDAHSPEKLGREANIMDCKLDYFDIINGIKSNDKRLSGTIEFYPEEGKYHYDGHRKCDICFRPSETKKHEGICPKCSKPLVKGVQYRVDELADKPEDYIHKTNKIVEYIIPLAEIIAEIEGVKSIKSKTVTRKYKEVFSSLGDEFTILREIPILEIEKQGYKELAIAIKKLRNKEIYVEPGYDGVYGTIKVFENQKEKSSELSGQSNFL